MPDDESEVDSEELQPGTPSPIQIASRIQMNVTETTPSTVIEQVEEVPAEIHTSTLNEVLDHEVFLQTFP